MRFREDFEVILSNFSRSCGLWQFLTGLNKRAQICNYERKVFNILYNVKKSCKFSHQRFQKAYATTRSTEGLLSGSFLWSHSFKPGIVWPSLKYREWNSTAFASFKRTASAFFFLGRLKFSSYCCNNLMALWYLMPARVSLELKSLCHKETLLLRRRRNELFNWLVHFKYSVNQHCFRMFLHFNFGHCNHLLLKIFWKYKFVIWE